MWVLYSMRTYQRRVHEYLYCPGMNLNCRSTRPCDRDASVVPRVLIGLPQIGPAVAEAGATMAGVERQRLRSSEKTALPRAGKAASTLGVICPMSSLAVSAPVRHTQPPPPLRPAACTHLYYFMCHVPAAQATFATEEGPTDS